MNTTQLTKKPLFRLLAAGIVSMAFAAAMTAQETSKTEVSQGLGSTQYQVERGEVIYVWGNEVVVRMENGEVRHVTAPDSARATVDGKELSVHELKPGMKLQRTIMTTTTPRYVTTIRTVQGKVFHVNAPGTVILTLADNTNKQYKVPKDQKFMIDGQEKTVFELRKGMNVSATVVTQVPETVVAQQRKVTGSAPPPPAIPQISGALLIEEAPAPPKQVAEAAPAAEPAPKKLPKTGSPVPLVGLMGLLSLGFSFGLRMFRRS
jgi:LPXTG-motif cell wall-anchored protein